MFVSAESDKDRKISIIEKYRNFQTWEIRKNVCYFLNIPRIKLDLLDYDITPSIKPFLQRKTIYFLKNQCTI